MPLLSAIQKTVGQLTNEFDLIRYERKQTILELTSFVKGKISEGKTAYLNFICTHNSRRSHLAQIWAQAAARHYNVSIVKCFSGGTEVSAFNPRAVQAMRKAGFDIVKTKEGDNPVYAVRYDDESEPMIAFSKTYDDPFNCNTDFAAIMTCSHADENCPLVLGASKRIAITYDDPKEFDGTPQEIEKYDERVNQIGRELLFAFSFVKC